MLKAMEWNDQEPILIEDLIKIGQDDGFEKGFEQSRAKALRGSLAAVLEARAIPLDETQRARIESEEDLDRLALWVRRAAVALEARAVLAD